MRALVLDDRARRRARKVRRYAARRVNWYDLSLPGWISRIPGHDQRHCCRLSTYRCVFSYTVDRPNNCVVRHLSVSVPGENYPSPAAVKAIAPLFGFSGSDGRFDAIYPDDWVTGVKQDDQVDDDCVILVQDIGIRLVA